MIVDPDFPDHWKTRMFVGLLGGDEAAPVYLLRLWAHCQNRRQSQFDGLPPEALKALCRFPGHANQLESSLAASGFVRRDDGRLIVLGWDEYNASLVASWTNGAKGGRPRKTHGFPVEVSGDGPSKPTGLPVDKPTGIPTGLREEKSREEEYTPPNPPRGGKGSGGGEGGAKAEDVPIPDVLRTEAFAAAWSEWLDFRKGSKKKGRGKGNPVSEKAARAQLKTLAEWGEPAAIQAIQRSIANDYQGLFPPSGYERQKAQATPPANGDLFAARCEERFQGRGNS